MSSPQRELVTTYNVSCLPPSAPPLPWSWALTLTFLALVPLVLAILCFYFHTCEHAHCRLPPWDKCSREEELSLAYSLGPWIPVTSPTVGMPWMLVEQMNLEIKGCISFLCLQQQITMNLVALNKNKCIRSQFWSPEVQNQFHRAKVGKTAFPSRTSKMFLASFQLLVAAGVLDVGLHHSNLCPCLCTAFSHVCVCVETSSASPL